MSTVLPSIHRGGGMQAPHPKAHPRVPPSSSSQNNGEAERTLADEYFDRICALENENEKSRGEMRQLRSLLSNNIQGREDETASALTLLQQQVTTLQGALASKLQADAAGHENEKQKAALLFGEVVRVGKHVESLEQQLQQQLTALDQRIQHVAETKSADLVRAHALSQQHSHEALVRDHTQSIEELRALVASMRSTVLQVKTDLEADRNERWKVELEKAQTVAHGKADAASWSEVEMRLQSQLDRLNNRVAMDKTEMLRMVEEQRDTAMAIEAKRMAHIVQDTKRMTDHVLGLEQWIQNEARALNHIVQSLSTDWDSRFRTLADEVAREVSTRSAAYQQLDDDMRSQWADLHDATRDVTVHVQHRLKEMEDIMPMEIKARQKGDERLKKRIEGLAKSLTQLLDSLRNDVESGRSATTVRVNGILATQLEMTTSIDHITSKLHKQLQTVQEDMRVALANALHITTRDFTDRLAAAADVTQTVERLQKTMDERLELMRQGWANMDNRTQDQLAQVHAHVDKGVADMHARLLAVYGDVEKSHVEVTQQNFVHHTALRTQLAALQTAQNVVESNLRGSVEHAVGSLNAAWTRSLEDMRVATAVEQCVANVVSQVVDDAATEAMGNMAWNTQQGFEWQAQHTNDAISAAVFDARVRQQAQASIDHVANQMRTIDARCTDAIARLGDNQTHVAGQVRQVQETLVAMAWNIEERSVHDIVSDVLRGCATAVASAATAHEMAGQLQDVGVHLRQLDVEVQVLRNNVDEVRMEAKQNDECERLRAAMASIHEQVNALAAALAAVQRAPMAAPPTDYTSFEL
ncbi:hypothetical protein H310_04857 [Aphanomyces invadans]|uniref:Uncharacterized protein n=1 Tax=Aphanomyces invadans TaxID=157072 RepID=A0A024UCN4_9STRA|nr:hypothetical protein H310_04857 [Aphanomyces invadans]ETW03378.1 hypothetical protein H310_04857 [Aphanomyces invadans]|eukprot:XP_008867607.1 hypothetical protein H310_04857 [Aphanomyces invadans]